MKRACLSRLNVKDCAPVLVTAGGCPQRPWASRLPRPGSFHQDPPRTLLWWSSWATARMAPLSLAHGPYLITHILVNSWLHQTPGEQLLPRSSPSSQSSCSDFPDVAHAQPLYSRNSQGPIWSAHVVFLEAFSLGLRGSAASARLPLGG